VKSFGSPPYCVNIQKIKKNTLLERNNDIVNEFAEKGILVFLHKKVLSPLPLVFTVSPRSTIPITLSALSLLS